MSLTARARVSAAFAALAAVGALLVWAPIASSSLDRWQLPKELFVEVCALGAIALAPRRERWTMLDAASVAAVVIAIASASTALVPWIGARLAALTLAGVALSSVLREADASTSAHGANANGSARLGHGRQRSPREPINADASTSAHGANANGSARLGYGRQRSPREPINADASTREAARCAVAVALGVVALIVLAETFGLVHGLSGHGRAPGATLGQRNAAAHVLAIGAPFAWRMAGMRSIAARVTGASVLAVSVAAIVATRSRAGWLALGLVVVVMLALGWRERALGRSLAIAALVVGAVVVVVAPRPALTWSQPRPYRDTLTRLFEADAGSGRGRIVQIEASLGLVTTSPWLGVGPGNWRVAYPSVSPTDDPTVETHAIDPVGRLLTSDVASTPVERGLLGALVALIAIVTLLGEVRRTEDPSLRAASFACIAALAPLMLFDTVLEVAPPVAVLAVLLTPAIPSDARPVPRGVGIALPLLATVLLVGAVVHRSAETWARVVGSDRAADTDTLVRAARMDPGDFEVRMRLARTYSLRGDCDAALSWLAEAIALRPHDTLPRAERDACRE